MENTGKKDNLRIFVGSISNELINDIQDLESRLGKLGKIVKPIEIHQKSLEDYNFAFVTMNLTKLEFKKLKNMFNGVNFKGSKLKIDLAKPDYKELWEKDSKRQDDHILHRKQRERIAACRLERIANAHANPFKLSLISKGRIRKTKRKTDLKNLTIRILMNGRLKIIKCRKTKLWGMNKNKSIRDLTSRFIAGEWRDGNEHVLDRLTKKVLVFEDDGVKVKDIAELDDSNEKYEEFNEEQKRTNKLLEDLLGKYDFDKPINFQEVENEEKAGSDYEVAGVLDRDDDDDDDEIEIVYDVPQKECVQPSQKSIVAEYINQHQDLIPQRNDYMDVKDTILGADEDDDEFFKNLTKTVITDKNDEKIKADNEKMLCSKQDLSTDCGNENNGKSYGEEGEEKKAEERKDEQDQNTDEDDGDDDDEFIPTFGGSDNSSNYNTADALRSLLNPDRQDDDDDDEIPQEDNFQNFEAVIPVIQKKDVGLFFAHFDSPFLVAQTQINKLREIKVNEELDYDKWFWDNRGELNREFRRRRRDVLRRTKKKTKNSALI